MCGNEPCAHELGDAITSFITQTKTLVKCQHERDAAREALARVSALCDEYAQNGPQGGLVMVETVRAALAPTEGDAL